LREEALRVIRDIINSGTCQKVYTEDMGFVDEAGLHLAGWRKFMNKPKGYQVYPPEVEKHIAFVIQW